MIASLALLLFAGAAPAIDPEAVTSVRLKGLVADRDPGLAVLVRPEIGIAAAIGVALEAGRGAAMRERWLRLAR